MSSINKRQKTVNMCLHAPTVIAVVNIVNSSTAATHVVNAFAIATATATAAITTTADSDTSSEHGSMPGLIEDIEDIEDEENESYDSEDNVPIRAKSQMDGAKTLDEAIVKLQNFIEHMKTLKSDGWELVDPIDDDWGFIRRTVQIVSE